jgi:predicted small lipoprotein YifL
MIVQMKRLMIIVVAALLTAACGLKGPLYLPGQSPKKPGETAPAASPTPPTDATVRTPNVPASSEAAK